MKPGDAFKGIRPQESGYKTDTRWLSLLVPNFKLKDILLT